MVSFKKYYFQNFNALGASEHLPKLKKALRLAFTAEVTIRIGRYLFQTLCKYSAGPILTVI